MEIVRSDQVTYEFPEMHPDERLRELILYIAEKCASDPEFSATLLNKILFYADFLSFAQRGKPVTGAAYQALDYGPAPKRLVPVRDMMIDAGELEIKEIPKFTYSRQQYVALRRADLDRLFRPTDIALVDEVIERLKGVSAQRISEFSHHRLWKIARGAGGNYRGLIPYEAMYISDAPPNEADTKRAKELSAKLGWAVD